MVWLGYKKQPMPSVGDAFLVPISKGVNTFCWVVRLHDKRKVYGGKKLGDYVMHSVVIACATWTGSGSPTQKELDACDVREAFDPFAPVLRPIGRLLLISASPPPKRWAKLGRIKRPSVDVPFMPAGIVTAADGTSSVAPSHAGFAGLHAHVKRAWDLAKDPRRALAKEAAEEAAILAQNEEADTPRRTRRRR